MPDERDQFADELLDKALARYSAVEPPLGLDTRVAARIREQAQPRSRIWMWAAVAVAALVLVVIGVRMMQRSVEQAPTVVEKTPALAVPQAAPPQQTPRTQPLAVARIVPPRRIQAAVQPIMVAAAPKATTFPAPSPLTEQERLLEAWAARLSPAEAAQPVMPSTQQDLTVGEIVLPELNVQEIEIKPLVESGREQRQEKQ